MKLTLKRFHFADTYTMGKLFINGKEFCDVIEDVNRDLNKDGDLKDANEGKVIAHALASATHGDALKLLSWALELHNGRVIDLDKSDQILFKDFISNSGLNNLVKYQAFCEFDQKEK
jgi:hypothetical protein